MGMGIGRWRLGQIALWLWLAALGNGAGITGSGIGARAGTARAAVLGRRPRHSEAFVPDAAGPMTHGVWRRDSRLHPAACLRSAHGAGARDMRRQSWEERGGWSARSGARLRQAPVWQRASPFAQTVQLGKSRGAGEPEPDEPPVGTGVSSGFDGATDLFAERVPRRDGNSAAWGVYKGETRQDRDWRVQLPKDMAKYRDLEPFIIVLEDALLEEGSGKGAPTGVSCVAAMNHLKRLWEHSNKKPGVARLEKRYRKLFLYFLDRAEPTIGKLRLKHLSVLLNALISQRWMDADRRRYTSKLCQDAVQQVLVEITVATAGAAAIERREALYKPARQESGSWDPDAALTFSSPLPDGARTQAPRYDGRCVCAHARPFCKRACALDQPRIAQGWMSYGQHMHAHAHAHALIHAHTHAHTLSPRLRPSHTFAWGGLGGWGREGGRTGGRVSHRSLNRLHCRRKGLVGQRPGA